MSYDYGELFLAVFQRDGDCVLRDHPHWSRIEPGSGWEAHHIIRQQDIARAINDQAYTGEAPQRMIDVARMDTRLVALVATDRHALIHNPADPRHKKFPKGTLPAGFWGAVEEHGLQSVAEVWIE